MIPDLPFEEAIAWFRERVPMTDVAWSVLTGRAKRRAFHVAGLTQLSLVQALYEGVRDQLEQGVNEERFQEQMAERLSNAWSDASEKYRAWRIRLVLRQELTNSFNAGRFLQASDPIVAHVFNRWLYSAVMDGNTTEICKALDGTILPNDDPFWLSHHPALHIGCRGTIIPLMEDQANEMGGVTASPPKVKVPDGFGGIPGQDEWEPDGIPGPLREVWNRKRRAAPDMPEEPVQSALPVRPGPAPSPLVASPRVREHAPGTPTFDGG